MATFQGELHKPAGRFALVAARFHSFLVDRLIDGAKAALAAHGVADEDVDLAYVPGSLEIPLAAERMAASGRYAAVVCLGAVVRGQTDHYDVVAGQSARGIADASLRTGVPVLNAVLTTNNLEQAIDRAGGESGNKGFDAALAAIEMADLMRRLPGAKT